MDVAAVLPRTIDESAVNAVRVLLEMPAMRQLAGINPVQEHEAASHEEQHDRASALAHATYSRALGRTAC